MKIENEVTGEISERLNNIIRVDRYLRGEKQFSSLDELEKQLQYDKSSII